MFLQNKLRNGTYARKILSANTSNLKEFEDCEQVSDFSKYDQIYFFH